METEQVLSYGISNCIACNVFLVSAANFAAYLLQYTWLYAILFLWLTNMLQMSQLTKHLLQTV